MAQKKEEKEEADRGKGRKTVLKSAQEWTMPAEPGQLETGQGGKRLLQSHLWVPDDL